ncbi:MAG: NUDIX hydrolase [Dehalococcoidales bacterium]|nr:NUDIX hydrolase [Dehalococcoidales bacterium]
MNRHTRYQGAIVRDHHILLIRHREHNTGRSYWIFPGGGMELDETEEACVQREMKEETNLGVRIISLLLDEAGYPGGVYQRLKTYLCEITGGRASPGIEPEPEVASEYSIVEVKWFDLRNEVNWNPELVSDPLTYLPLQHVRRRLGYQRRYQGAIVRDHHILLLWQRVFPSGRTVWIFPGGGMEPGETEEECVKREMKEETDLDVKVKEFILDEPGAPTYLCEPLSGDAKPGHDPEYAPEIEAAGLHGILAVRWFDLRSEATWDPALVNDPIIYLPLQRMRRKLGYLP